MRTCQISGKALKLRLITCTLCSCSFSIILYHTNNGISTISFDVVFSSGSPPLFEKRATFLTGSLLDSARGFRARRQDRLPTVEVAQSAAWHFNLCPTLNQIAPDVFDKTEPSKSLVPRDPYRVSRDEELPVADRRETEARERLALDLALATYVYSGLPFKKTNLQQTSSAADGEEPNLSQEVRSQEEEETLLTQAAERLSLQHGTDARGAVPPPPKVQFGYLRPVERDPGRHYRSDVDAGASADASRSASRSRLKAKSKSGERTKSKDDDKAITTKFDDGVEPTLPLGVRLLISEWTVGDDPGAYTYVDPYDLDSAGAVAGHAPLRGRRKEAGDKENEGEGALGAQIGLSSIRAPPTIVAARSVASQPKAPAVGVARVPIQTQTQTLVPTLRGTQLQSQSTIGSSQPAMMPQTQVLPGPYGGRPSTAKKRPKKRIGGF